MSKNLWYNTFYFVGRNAKFIKFVFDNGNSCGLIDPKVNIFILK